MRKSFLLLLMLIVSVFITAQPQRNMQGGTIKGFVYDKSSGHEVEYANIILFNSKDSSQITGTITDVQGRFELNRIRPGNYYLNVHFIGFDTEIIDDIKISRGSINIDLGKIEISPATVNLSDVVVEGERVPVSYQIDKKVINVEQMATTISGSAVDVLENIPSVTVDIDGNVSLRGSGSFTVLVDGRPTIVDAQDVLQQIPASSIENIEIITNPSAKYDPEGTSGIINIIMKKNKNLGTSGVANLNAGLNDKYGGDILIEFKNPKFTTVIGLDYNNRFFDGSMSERRIFSYQDNTLFMNSSGDLTRGRKHYGARGSFNWNISDNDVLGFSTRLGSRKMQFNNNSNYTEFYQNDPSVSNYFNFGTRERSGEFFSGGINYQHKFTKKGHQLTADILYEYDKGDELTISQMILNNAIIEGRKNTEKGPGNEFRTKLDYILPLSENAKFEAGFEGESERSEEETGLYEYDITKSDFVFIPDYSYLTKADKDEYAVYSIFSSKIKEFGFQAGVRGEYTYRNIELVKTGNSFNVDEFDYFPTIHFSYKLPSGMQFMTSYTKRIQRPRNWALEPFETWMDANTVRRGNPSLLPELIDSYEFGFQTLIGKAAFSAEAYYRISSNKIEWIRSVYSEDVTLQTFENIGKDYALGTELMINLNPLKFWSLDLMGDLFDYRLKGNILGDNVDKSSFNWRSRINNSFKIGKTWQIQVSGNYVSPSVSSQGRTEGFFMTGLALKKELMDNKLSLTLQARDLFGSFKHEMTTESLGLYSYRSFERESPMLILNVKYLINNFKQRRERSQGGDDDMDGEF